MEMWIRWHLFHHHLAYLCARVGHNPKLGAVR